MCVYVKVCKFVRAFFIQFCNKLMSIINGTKTTRKTMFVNQVLQYSPSGLTLICDWHSLSDVPEFDKILQ